MAKAKLNLKSLNNFLSVAVCLLALYILLIPFLPQIAFYIEKLSGKTENSAAAVNEKASVLSSNSNNSAQNILIIPSINLTIKINEGNSLSALKDGVWRRPNTSTPDRSDNTVIVGHRFTYDGASYFYNLDKVSVGDYIGVVWDKKTYIYRVSEIKIAEPNDPGVERRTAGPLLTLYTCTPLWTAKQRLVVRANLENIL